MIPHKASATNRRITLGIPAESFPEKSIICARILPAILLLLMGVSFLSVYFCNALVSVIITEGGSFFKKKVTPKINKARNTA